VIASVPLLTFLSLSPPTGGHPPIALLDLGAYRKQDLPAAAASAREWLALCRTESTVELKKVKVTIKAGRGPRAPREVATAGCPYALALLRSPALREGKVETVADEQGVFTFHGTRTVVRRDAPDPDTDATCGVKRVHLVLSAGEVKQTLTEADFCTVFTLLWGGDLDGDGKLDLLVAENLDSGGIILRLFLSTRASGDGTAVGPAASIQHGG
jgi:hypothetical protein